MLKSTDFLRRIIAPARGQEVSRCHICAQIATASHWRTTCGGFQLERSTAVGGAQSVEKNMNGERPAGCWWCKQVRVPVRQRCSKRMRCRKICVKTFVQTESDCVVNCLRVFFWHDKDTHPPTRRGTTTWDIQSFVFRKCRILAPGGFVRPRAMGEFSPSTVPKASQKQTYSLDAQSDVPCKTPPSNASDNHE